MFAIFEDGGKFLGGRILSEAETTAQIELESGKRVKVKAANQLLRFEKPLPAELMASAQALAAGHKVQVFESRFRAMKLTLTDIQDLTAANFGGSASATIIKTAASQKLVVIADKAADADSIQNIYYVTTDASNVATVTLVGTINEGTFHTDNIITA